MATQGLPMGYGSSTNLPLDIDDLACLLKSSTRSPHPNKVHTILVYFARGNLKGGDEAKLTKLNVPTNTHIAHVVDVQPMYKKAFPQYDFGKKTKGWLHNLEEVAELIGVPFVTQDMLKTSAPEFRHKVFEGAPMRHNAAGDVLVTLIALIELLRYNGLDFSTIGDWNLMGYDFEGGSKYASGVTEVGVAQIHTRDLRRQPSGMGYHQSIQVNHAVVHETIGHYLHSGGEANMGIDRKDPATHPRFNHRSGPNGTKKKNVTIKDRQGISKTYTMSADTELLRHCQIGQWLLSKIPVKPTTYDVTYSLSDHPATSCRGLIGTFDEQTQKSRYRQLLNRPKVVLYEQDF